jgi:hypothetical protein
VNLRLPRPVAICLAALAVACGLEPCSRPALAQQPYRNIVNQRFHTVSNGPQSVIVVDVADPNDEAGVRRAVSQQMATVNKARMPALQREMAFLRKYRKIKPNQHMTLVDTVFLRQNGRLVVPPPAAKKEITRGPDPGNTLTYVISEGTGENQFNPVTAGQDIQNLTALYTALNTEFTTLLGPPLYTGTVTFLDEDDNPDLNSGIIGVTVVVNGTNVSIHLPLDAFNGLNQDEVLGVAQAMAQAWHGPLAIGYDAWEKGMARAIAMIATRTLSMSAAFQSFGIDPYNSFYYTPYYDLENQPSLGNNTFLPPTQSAQDLSGLGGMIAPRLATSGSAWLKCYIENPNFFQTFNSLYYDADTADPTVALNTTTLESLAGQAAGGSVEGQTFPVWFEQQYVFDTSVIPGPKLYVNVVPTPPSTTSTDDGVALALLYYQTTATGDETDLGGTAYPLYLSYDSTAQLSIGDPSVTILNGQGDTGPLFDGIGTSPERLIIDIPIDSNYQRLYYPALESTSGSGGSLVYNDFYGVVVGSDTGNLTSTWNGGGITPFTTPVSDGAFGGVGGSTIPSNLFTKASFSYQPASGGSPVLFQRNVYERKESATLQGVQNIFVFNVPAGLTTLTNTFQAGYVMISLPIQPVNPDLSATFGTPKNATLLAQYRQNATTANQYLQYPSLPLYQPGYALWSNFTGAISNLQITGTGTANEQTVEVSLQWGWNMIGNPFTANLDVTNDETTGFTGGGILITPNGGANQGTSETFAQAITNGDMATGIFGYDSFIVGSTLGGSDTYVDITNLPNPNTTQFTLNQLETWKGYWVLVTNTSGVTLTYVNPSPTTRAAVGTTKKAVQKSTTKAATSNVATSNVGTWKLPLMLQDDQGHTAYATMGQASRGADSYVAALDAATPPAFSPKAAFGVRFPHPEWGTNAGTTNYLTDIRKSNADATWDVTVDLPQGQKTYSLAWGATATLPRGTSLTLTDKATGATQLMNTTTRYAFTPNQGETSRNFQIAVVPRGLSNLAISDLRVTSPQVRGRAATSATISYEMVGVADASIQILGGTGRSVRHLLTGRAATTGINQAVWDLRDDKGVSVSAGTYIIEVQAVTSDGRQTRAVYTYLLTR